MGGSLNPNTSLKNRKKQCNYLKTQPFPEKKPGDVIEKFFLVEYTKKRMESANPSLKQQLF